MSKFEENNWKLREYSYQFVSGYLTDNGAMIFWSKNRPIMNSEGTRVIPPNDIFVEVIIPRKDYEHTEYNHPIVVDCNKHKMINSSGVAEKVMYRNDKETWWSYNDLNSPDSMISQMTKGSVIFVRPCTSAGELLGKASCEDVEESWNSYVTGVWTATYIPETGLLRLIHK